MFWQETSGVNFYNSVTAFRFPKVSSTCPPGMKLTGGGGGCISLSNIGWVFLVKSQPENNNSWYVFCDSQRDQNVKAEVWATCE